MEVVVNRLDVTILKILAQEQCFDEISGMTINEINAFYGEDDLLTTRHNLGVRIRRLVQAGYMEKGIKDHLEFTYFITERGLTVIKWNGGNDNE